MRCILLNETFKPLVGEIGFLQIVEKDMTCVSRCRDELGRVGDDARIIDFLYLVEKEMSKSSRYGFPRFLLRFHGC